MADKEDTKKDSNSWKNDNSGPKEVVNVCKLNIPSMIAALHSKAVFEVSKKAADVIVVNSAIEGDGKTAKLKSAGQHIISILAKDEGSKVIKTKAFEALKIYVQWFIGPDLADEIDDSDLIPLVNTNKGANFNDNSKDDEDQQDESLKLGFPNKSFIDFINEAGDEDVDDSNDKVSDDKGDDTVNPEEKDVDEEQAPGYYIAYNISIPGMKQTALKDAIKKSLPSFLSFFDTVTFFGSGLFGGSYNKTVKDIKNEIKDQWNKVFGKIDPADLKTAIQHKLDKKFPDLRDYISVDVRDKNTLLHDLKGKEGFDSKIEAAVSSSDYTLTVRVEKSQKQKKFLNRQIIADIVTSSIHGFVKKLRNEITKDDVYLISNYIDVNLDKKQQQMIRKLEIDIIQKPEQIKALVNKLLYSIKNNDIMDVKTSDKKFSEKERTNLMSQLIKKFSDIKKNEAYKYSKKAHEIINFWNKFYEKYQKSNTLTVQDIKKFINDYKKKYKELGLEDNNYDDEDDYLNDSKLFTFIPGVKLQKMILEALFDEYIPLTEDGEFADLMADYSEKKNVNKNDSKEDIDTKDSNKDKSTKSAKDVDDNRDDTFNETPEFYDEDESGESLGYNTRNSSSKKNGDDLYLIPMPGLKYPDDNDGDRYE